MKIAEIHSGDIAFSSVHGGLHRPRSMKPRHTNLATNMRQKIKAKYKEVDRPELYIVALWKDSKASRKRIESIIKRIIKG